MLVIGREDQDAVDFVINKGDAGEDIKITVRTWRDPRNSRMIKLGITAPKSVQVLRHEAIKRMP